MTRRRKRYRQESSRQFVKRGDSDVVRMAIRDRWETPLNNQRRIIEDIVEMGLNKPPRRSLAAFKVFLEVQKIQSKTLEACVTD